MVLLSLVLLPPPNILFVFMFISSPCRHRIFINFLTTLIALVAILSRQYYIVILTFRNLPQTFSGTGMNVVTAASQPPALHIVTCYRQRYHIVVGLQQNYQNCCFCAIHIQWWLCTLLCTYEKLFHAARCASASRNWACRVQTMQYHVPHSISLPSVIVIGILFLYFLCSSF